MSLYVYCLGRDLAGARVESLAGVGGAPVRLLEFESGLAVIVGDFEGGRVATTREHLRAHNSVLARVLAETTPLPFRFGTLAEAAQLESYVSKNREALGANLERVRGCVEMSVKILWDEAAAVSSPEGSTDAARPAVAGGARASETGGGGAAFLAAKRAELMGGQRLRARAEEINAWAEARLAPLARESRSGLAPAERIVVRASHLVERARLDAYREAARVLREERGAELRFLTSGPWPPYSFCDLRP